MAGLKDFDRVFLLDVEVEELVLQVLVGRATVDDSILRPVYLEQEQHIVLVYLAAASITLHQLINLSLNAHQLVYLEA